MSVVVGVTISGLGRLESYGRRAEGMGWAMDDLGELVEAKGKRTEKIEDRFPGIIMNER